MECPSGMGIINDRGKVAQVIIGILGNSILAVRMCFLWGGEIMCL